MSLAVFHLFCVVVWCRPTGQIEDWDARHKKECMIRPFAVGEAIVIRSLVSAAALNGRKGKVIAEQNEAGRVGVLLFPVEGEPAKEISVKPANLYHADIFTARARSSEGAEEEDEGKPAPDQPAKSKKKNKKSLILPSVT